MSTKYSVTIMRHREDEDPEELTDRWISADQAIDLMMQVNEMEDDSSEEEESEPEEEEEIDDEPEEEPASKKKSRAWNSMPGRKADWDKEKARDMIKDGEKPAAIADEVGTSVGNIYQLKSQMKKDGELEGGEEEVDKPVVIKSHQQKVVEMVKAGKTDTEVYNEMHDFMTAGELRTALEYARALA